MCKIFSTVVIALGVLVGILVNVLSPESLPNIVFIPKFFEVFLPILGAGALIKYLFSYSCGCACCSKDKGCGTPK